VNYKQEFAKGIPIPFEPDSVMRPSILYGEATCILYTTGDDKHVRVTFENFDSLSVCRGEYLPYASNNVPGAPYRSCYVIENSSWLVERHAYESKHYRGCYEFGNNVDEMLTEFDHYLLAFHDQFIEAIAAGIWFEQREEAFNLDTSYTDHPLMDLPENKTIEHFELYGIRCQVRSAEVAEQEIIQSSTYCSQPLFHFAMELDGRCSVSCRFDVRTRRGSTKTTWRNSLGRVEHRQDGLVTLLEAKALIQPYIKEVYERRRKMGKQK